MGDIDYHNLRFMVADDFGSFRSTINAMLTKMGIMHIELVPSGEAMIAACEKRFFDVILSDYDLGPGRNGQRVLEELRHRRLISRRTLFMLISANASKEVVLASYDCEPDDYLAKPITARILEQRLERLLIQRKALMPCFQALEKNDRPRAISLLTDLSIANNRHSLAAQKLLGELFLEQGDLDKAERLYSLALQSRPLDWARLGLAKIKHLRGEMELAGEWMDKIVTDNPLYLPAYDALANNWQERGNSAFEQQTLERALDVSPMSILRQKRLARLAESNGDTATALRAWRRALKLGEHSCHAEAKDNLQFARIAAGALESRQESDVKISNEAAQALIVANEKYNLEVTHQLQAELLRGRLLALEGKTDAAKSLIERAESRILDDNIRDIDTDIERACAKLALSTGEDTEQFIRELLQRYAYDQEALEKLDKLLAEPVSESNQTLVASINREGIELYNQGSYNEAIDCFERARKLFPKHVGIQLNIVQALVGKKKLGETDTRLEKQLEESLAFIATLVDTEHSQYPRYKRLRQMAYANSTA